LEQSTIALQTEIDTLDEQTLKADKFLELTKRYSDFTEITTPMLHEFIERVIVHERVKMFRGKKHQRIDVCFNFIGMVGLPAVEYMVEPEPLERHVASNSKFLPLEEYLKKQDEPTLMITYAEIEEILGKPLCKSAYKYPAYWYPAYNRPANNVIYNAGYDVEKVDLKGQMLVLVKPEIVNAK